MSSVSVDEILLLIQGHYEGAERLDYDSVPELYAKACQLFEESPLRVSVVRLDSMLKIQFTDRSKFHVLVDCPDNRITRESLERVVPPAALDWVDAIGHNTSFLSFIGSELSNNKRLLGIVAFVYFAVLWLWGNYEGLSNYFVATSQVVSVVVALFIVFTTIQQSWARNDPTLLVGGYLSKCHRIDKHLIALTILLVLVCVFSIIAAQQYCAIPVTITAREAAWSFDLTWTTMVVAGLVAVIDMTIVFLAIYQYYFDQGKEFLFDRLSRELLYDKYDQRQLEKKIRSFSGDGKPQ